MRTIAFCIVSIGLLTGCTAKNDKPSAEASINVNLEETKDSVAKTWNNAEREIKKGAEQASAKLKDAGEVIKDKVEEAKETLSDDKGPSVKVEVNKN